MTAASSGALCLTAQSLMNLAVRFPGQSALGFEKICVLFNIAALESQIAANQNMESDDGLKVAATDFQKSAGTFQHIKDHVQSTIQQEPTPDLLQDTLTALATLMIAQAQEVFFFKSTRGGQTSFLGDRTEKWKFRPLKRFFTEQMKDSVIAKIAAQAADSYSVALRLMQKDHLRSNWDKVRFVETKCGICFLVYLWSLLNTEGYSCTVLLLHVVVVRN